MTKRVIIAQFVALSASLHLLAADLTVASGERKTISEDATYDNVIVHGELILSKGKKFTAGDMHVMPKGYLKLNGSTTSFASVNVNGDGSITDQEESSSTHATVNVSGDGDSKMTQLGTAYTVLNKSGAGTLTIAPRNAMHSLSVSGGKVIVQSRAAAGYRYYKFIVDECRSKSSNATQIDEMYWFDENGADLSATRTAPTGSVYGYQLYDRTAATKWYQGGDKSGWTITTSFPGARRFHSYIWNTANDEKVRDPSAWRVRGSMDNTIWQTIAQVTNFVATDTRNAPASATNFTFSAPQIVTIPTVRLNAGTALEVESDTTLSVTDLSSADFGKTLSFSSITIKDGGTFAWNPSADETLTFLSLNGGGTFRKEGPQTVTVWSDGTSVGGLHVADGTLALRTARRETRRCFKFNFYKSYWMTTHPEGDYSANNDRHKLQFSELALYDEKGVRVNEGSNVQNISWPWGGQTSTSLFDDNTGTSCYSTRVPGQTEIVSFEIKEGGATSVVGYRFCSPYNYDYCDSMPGEWKVFARASSSDEWELIDHRVYAGGKGTYWNAMNGGQPFVFTNASETISALAPSCKVKIDGGATLDVSGTATTFANLAVDCSAASEAKIVGGELAQTGEIAFENVTMSQGSTLTVPLTFNGTAGTEHIGNWTFTVNGKEPRNICLSSIDGRLVLRKRGLVLIVQ